MDLEVTMHVWLTACRRFPLHGPLFKPTGVTSRVIEVIIFKLPSYGCTFSGYNILRIDHVSFVCYLKMTETRIRYPTTQRQWHMHACLYSYALTSGLKLFVHIETKMVLKFAWLDK